MSSGSTPTPRRSRSSSRSEEAHFPRLERRRSFLGGATTGLVTVLPLIGAVFMFGVLVGTAMVQGPGEDMAESALRRSLRGSGETRPATNTAVGTTATDAAVEPPPPVEPQPPPPGPVDAAVAPPAPGSWSAELLRVTSLRISDGGTYGEARGPSDAGSTTVGAWIYLDGQDRSEVIKTVASNKVSGCDQGSDGLALAVNEWETSDRQLTLEWGDRETGCRKLGSGMTKVPYDRWTHVAASLGSAGDAVIYLDGEVAARKPPAVMRTASKRALRVGQYADGTHPFVGNVSGVFVVQGIADPVWVRRIATETKPGPEAAAEVVRRAQGTVLALLTHPSFDDVSSDGGAEPATVVPASARVQVVVPPRTGSLPIGSLGNGALSGGYALGEGVSSGPFSREALEASDQKAAPRAIQVKEAMAHAWRGYKAHAWGRDELKPVSGRGHDNWGGLAVTMVDSLDTLWLMGLKSEFDEAVDWLGSNLRFDRTGEVSVFETTIRELGGLLAAYDLSKRPVLLEKAADLGRRLAGAFETPTGLPLGSLNLRDGRGKNAGWTGGNAVLAELGSLQLEFRYLASASKDASFAEKANRVFERMLALNPADGLFPIYVSSSSGQIASRKITWGALGDSFYEYLLKTWIQGGKVEARLREAYDSSIDGLAKRLIQVSTPSNLAYVADLENGQLVHKMDHLVCFLPGVLGLGAYTDPNGLDSPRARRDLNLAKALLHTCVQMYDRMPTRLAPEFVTFKAGRDMQAAPSAPFNILRPETAESLFVLHFLTKDPVYRDWSWRIFQAFDAKCKTDLAFGSYPDVRDSKPRRPDDRMESFFLAETLKYLFLIQAPPDTLNLMDVVFNTEAHPLQVLGPDGPHLSSALKRRARF